MIELSLGYGFDVVVVQFPQCPVEPFHYSQPRFLSSGRSETHVMNPSGSAEQGELFAELFSLIRVNGFEHERSIRRIQITTQLQKSLIRDCPIPISGYFGFQPFRFLLYIDVQI